MAIVVVSWLAPPAETADPDPLALQRRGGAQDVPTLAPLLLKQDQSMAARLALESIPGPEAGEALRAAVEQTSGLIKVGIIDSLGSRREATAVATLAKALADPDPMVVASAAVALGKIGTLECAKALEAVADKVPAAIRPTFSDGCLLCADRLAAKGEKTAAAEIYRRFTRPGQPRAARMAGLQGLLNVAGPNKEAMVIELITTGGPDDSDIALSHLNALSSESLNGLAKRISGRSAFAQAAVLTALASRGEKSALPFALESARSTDASVRHAAFDALGDLGDLSAVTVLIAVIAPSDPAANVARRSLVRLRHPDADKAIIAAVREEKDPARRGALISVLLARRSKPALPVFLEEAAGPDATSRSRAIVALGRLAAPDDLPAVVGLILKVQNDTDRDGVERAVAEVARQIPDPDRRTEAVLAAGATSGAGKAALLPMLGRIGGQKALDLTRAALADQDAVMRDAGMRALCNWPDATVATMLLETAKNSPVETHRQAALRAFARVISLPSKAPADATLSLLKEAMSMATRDEDRALIIGRCAAVRTIETLRFVVPHLDNAALAPAACKTVVELAHHKGLREPNKAEFQAALTKTIAICKDGQLVDRAKRYLEGY